MIRDFITSTGRLLLYIYENGGEIEIKQGREIFGSYIYALMLNLARYSLAVIIETNKYKKIKLTEKGKELAECLKNCFNKFEE